MLKIDGEEWVGKIILESFTENFEIIFDGEEAYTQSNRLYSGEPVGTRYSHCGQARRNPIIPNSEWDRFYKLLSAPIASHTVEVPHNQGTLVYEAKIRTGSRTLKEIGVWGDTIDFEFVPLEVQRETANGND